MRSFQYLTTLITLTLLASHQAVAAPASENQARARGHSQSAASPSPSGNVIISSIGTDGTTVVEWNPTAAVDLAKSINKNVDDQITAAFGSVPNAVNGPAGGDLAKSINNDVDNQIAAAFDKISNAVDA